MKKEYVKPEMTIENVDMDEQYMLAASEGMSFTEDNSEGCGSLFGESLGDGFSAW